MSPPAKLRVGSVPYLVARPLDGGLDEEPGIELVRDVPARLVQGLREGALDVALVSSVELFRRPGYRYLDGLAVAGEAFVSSVQLFLRRPLPELGRIALDPASRTSAALVRAVLAEGEQLRPDFVEVPAGRDPRAEEADAWLRIGDPALREFLDPTAPPVFNPSAAWRRLTDLPFVFAAWIARPGADLAPHLAAFARARQRGRANLVPLAEDAARTLRLPLEALRRYLADECLYDPSPERMRASLLAFRDRLAPLDLCRADLTPDAIVPMP